MTATKSRTKRSMVVTYPNGSPTITPMAESLRAEVRRAENGEWFFVLLAGNNEVIATGETYKNQADAIHTAELILVGQGHAVVVLE